MTNFPLGQGWGGGGVGGPKTINKDIEFFRGR